MSEPFLAEVRIVGFNFAPRGWAFCDGQILPINQNQSLYSLLGTTYGGDGRTSFALPDLRGRVPIHTGLSNGGADYREGQKSGEETHSLADNEMPTHNHQVQATNTPASGGGGPVGSNNPGGKVLAGIDINGYKGASNNLVNLNQITITNVGGSQAHNNMMPYLTVNFCIALQGLFPSRN